MKGDATRLGLHGHKIFLFAPTSHFLSEGATSSVVLVDEIFSSTNIEGIEKFDLPRAKDVVDIGGVLAIETLVRSFFPA